MQLYILGAIFVPLVVGKVISYVCSNHFRARFYGFLGACCTAMLVLLVLLNQVPTEANTVGESGERIGRGLITAIWGLGSIISFWLYGLATNKR